jgi:hypothetical protein
MDAVLAADVFNKFFNDKVPLVASALDAGLQSITKPCPTQSTPSVFLNCYSFATVKLALVDRLTCVAPTKTSLSTAYVALKSSIADLYMATIILNR